MQMLIKFDVNAGIIDVPEEVVEHRNRYRNQFYKWLSDPRTKHKYWTKIKNRDGSTTMGFCDRSDAFVEWLNRKLRKTGNQAVILQSGVVIDEYQDKLPSIFF